ncbi:hypothetical protein SOVF_024350 [Spinacia oleracea]|nr:hypothetical protein SOVF_024350 [Spinacia oleracea]
MERVIMFNYMKLIILLAFVLIASAGPMYVKTSETTGTQSLHGTRAAAGGRNKFYEVVQNTIEDQFEATNNKKKEACIMYNKRLSL